MEQLTCASPRQLTSVEQAGGGITSQQPTPSLKQLSTYNNQKTTYNQQQPTISTNDQQRPTTNNKYQTTNTNKQQEQKEILQGILFE